MKWIARTAAFAAILGATAFGGWACTDDKGNALTLEEYFQQLDELDNQSSDRGDALFADIDLTDLDAVKGAYAEFPDIVEDFITGLEDLNPPDEAKDAHDEAIAAAEGFREVLNDAVDEAQNATALDDLQQIGEGEAFTEADDRFTSACLDLEEIATDNNIEVDLDCEDS